jgi:D-3-phosphoglycerate dehydrogenase
MAGKHFTVIITDLDQGHARQEESVFAGTECELIQLQLHTEQEVIDACADADSLLVQYAPITPRVVPHLKKCQMLSRYGVGYDTINVPAATQAGILVANVPDYGTEEVSLQALTLALTIYRGVDVCNRSIRAGEWEYQVAAPISEAVSLTVGVFGTGRIGSAFAAKAHALGFRVIGCDRERSRVPSFATAVDFDTLLRESDIISAHSDLNESTAHIFSDDSFARMKKDAIFVNTSRGGVVDEKALVRALKDGRFRGVGLDVVENERLEPESELRLFPRVLLTPHIAWYSEQARVRLKQRTALNALWTLRGRLSPYVLNPEVLRSPLLRFKANPACPTPQA